VLRKFLIVFLVIMLGCFHAYADAPVSENTLKAAFIYHFISFTQWHDDEPSYYVCIPDDEDLRETARDAFKGKTINNRRVIVVSRTPSCHILVSDGKPTSAKALTIGQLNKGALFEFRKINQKIKFAVNLDKVQKAQFKVSSQLLKLAIIDKDSL